jgi:hypothetical protein
MESFAERGSALLAQLRERVAIESLLQRRKASSDLSERRALLDRARMKLLAEAELILVQEEFPVMPLYYYVEAGMVAPGLRGIYTELEQPGGGHVPNLRGIHPLRDIWFEGTRH